MPGGHGPREQVEQRCSVSNPVAFLRTERDLNTLGIDVGHGHETQRQQQHEGDQQNLLRVPQPPQQQFCRIKEHPHFTYTPFPAPGTVAAIATPRLPRRPRGGT